MGIQNILNWMAGSAPTETKQ